MGILIPQKSSYWNFYHLSQHGDSYHRDMVISQLSCLYYGNPYTGKETSLYWNSPLKWYCYKICECEKAMRLPYLYNRDPNTGKKAALNCNSPMEQNCFCQCYFMMPFHMWSQHEITDGDLYQWWNKLPISMKSQRKISGDIYWKHIHLCVLKYNLSAV